MIKRRKAVATLSPFHAACCLGVKPSALREPGPGTYLPHHFAAGGWSRAGAAARSPLLPYPPKQKKKKKRREYQASEPTGGSSGSSHGARRQLRPHRRRARLLPRGAGRGPRRPGRAPRRRPLPRPPRHPLRPPLRAPHRRREWPPRGASSSSCSAMLCSPFIHGWLLSQLPASQPPRSPLSISFLQVLSMVLDHGVPPDAVNRHKQVRDPNPIDAYFSPSPLQRISPGLPASKSAPFFTASNQIKGQKSHLFSPACFSLSRLR